MHKGDSSFAEDAAQTNCISCGYKGLFPVIDLGSMPPSDELLDAASQNSREETLPLRMGSCPSCNLVQLLEVYPPERMFGKDYLYFSSVSETFMHHCEENAKELIKMLNLDSDSLVVEIASNDGYLLRHFATRDVPVLGVDPAPRQADAARKKGLETIEAFFGLKFAQSLRQNRRSADLIIANNVVAHVTDPNDLIAGMAELLSPQGMVVVEFPYVRDLIDKLEFDTIYHEHRCYFSVTSAQALFMRHGLILNDIRRYPVHGGSLRLYFKKSGEPSKAVTDMLDDERQAGLLGEEFYENFSTRVKSFRSKAHTLIDQLKRNGHSIAAYGAAAKGTILLNYLGLNANVIDFVADKNPHKWGRQIPGTGIPIVTPEQLESKMPDYVLILPWNLRDEIVRQQANYLDGGGKFIVPLPDLEIVGS